MSHEGVPPQILEERNMLLVSQLQKAYNRFWNRFNELINE
jgi:hypothetical protein